MQPFSIIRQTGLHSRSIAAATLRSLVSRPLTTSTSPPALRACTSCQPLRHRPLQPLRYFSTTSQPADKVDDESAATKDVDNSTEDDSDNPLNEPREAMHFDVVIVGAGPAGLTAAIRLKQNAEKAGEEISICVVEKGSEIGAHIISGNVFEPRALDELYPNWRTECKDDEYFPFQQKVTHDEFYVLSQNRSLRTPLPPTLHNDGNYIISLSQMTRWLAGKAEELGIEIYPGFAASELLYKKGSDEQDVVIGIATSDMGVDKNGKPKDTFTRGMELRAHQTFFAEGCRGSLSEKLIAKYQLRQQNDADPQTYGIGLKEVWKLRKEIVDQKRGGTVIHTVGWPLPTDTYAGSFMYFLDDSTVQVGMVIGLDYANPYLNPYNEFQQWKTHPRIRDILQGGECQQYGARALNEGGYQSIPKLTFPGGLLIGCSAGFLNVPKIKGTHTAMKSGMVAADSIFEALKTSSSSTSSTSEQSEDSNEDDESEVPALLQPIAGQELTHYGTHMSNSWVYKELKAVRNIHPAFHKYGGLYPFMLYSALEAWILRGRGGWTFRNDKEDWQKTKKASECSEIKYPTPDGELTFDLLSNLQRSGVNHADNQPIHLRVRPGMQNVPADISFSEYAAPESRFCPAKVYEYTTETPDNKPKLLINAQNCVHCKTCSIKTPQNYIDWTVPEGGGGPKYANGM